MFTPSPPRAGLEIVAHGRRYVLGREQVTTMRPIPDAKLVREVLDYDRESGKFTYKNRQAAGRKSCHPSGIGGFDPYGYHRIFVGGRQLLAHRLAWAHVYGEWPSEIDHANGDRSDNRLCNLRECTRKENMRNRATQKNNTVGFKGVNAIRLKCGEIKYRAKINVDGECVHLGCYDDPSDAHFAYAEASRAAFGAFARTQ